MMIYAIIIDGHHWRTVINLPEIMPTIKLLYHHKINFEPINSAYPQETLEYIEYKLALTSEDGLCALYSSNGSSTALFTNLGWSEALFDKKRIENYTPPQLVRWNNDTFIEDKPDETK